MYLKQNRNSAGRIILTFYRSYRDTNGKPKSKLVKTIGFLDELQKDYDDPVLHFKHEATRLSSLEKEEASSFSFSPNLKEITPVDLDVSKNLGYAYLQKIYYDLGLSSFFKNKQRSTNIQYNLNNVIRMLVYSRILYPDSKASSFKNSSRFFEKMAPTLDSVYDALSRVANWQDELQRHLHESVRTLYGRDDEKAYFDCTNYYFEINEEDDLRRKGPSKEHRKSPIIQMGLLMDTNGIPMAYRTFPGNESEKVNLRPVIDRCRRDYDLKRIIVVADKGLNTSDNIFYIQGKHDGYIYSQSIRGADKEFKDWVTDLTEYQLNPTYLDEETIIKDSNCRDLHDIKMMKSRTIGKSLKIKAENGSRTHSITIKQKQIVYFSLKFKKRAQHERQNAVEKAKRMIINPGSYASATNYGANQYVKAYIQNKETGEMTAVAAMSKKEKNRIEKLKKAYEENSSETAINDYTKYIESLELSLDTELIKEQEKYDGYYSVVTSEFDKSDQEILQIYRGLWKIEESFKITKSELKARPVYLSDSKRIEAHFFTCFLSLMILRIVEHLTEREYSPHQLIDSLRKFDYVPLGENLYQCVYRDKLLASLDTVMGLDLSHRYMRLGDIKKILAVSKK